MDSVPSEIKQIIAAFLDNNSKWRMRSTNTEWLKIIAVDEYICYHINEEKLNDIVETLEKLNKPISLDLRKNVIQDLPEITTKLTRLTNLTGLKIAQISPQTMTADAFMVLTVLKNLKKININGFTTRFPHHFSKLEEADIHLDGSFDFSHLTCLQKLRMDLTSSEILPTMLSSFEKLTYLSIYSMKNDATRISMEKLTALQELNMTRRTFDSLNSTNLTSFGMYGVLPKELFISSLVNLKSLRLNVRPVNNFHFLTALTALEECHLEIIASSMDKEILSYFNSKKLRHFSTVGEITLSTLSKLTTLRSLEVGISKDSHVLDIQQIKSSLTSLDLKINADDLNMDLSNLTQLQTLQLTYRIAAKLALPSSLTKLALNDFLDENVTETGIDLSNLPNLEVLRLRRDQYIGLEKLTNLTRIDIHTRSTSMDCGLLSNLTQLKMVYCSAPLPIVDYLSNATNIQELSVVVTGAEQLEKVAQFGHLTGLSLFQQTKRFHERADLINTPLTRLTNLECLRFGKSSGLKQLQAFMPRLWQPVDDF